MKFIYKILVVFAGVFTFTSCQFFDYDKQYNPYAVTPENAGVDFLYNNIQLDFNSFYRSAHGFASRPSRMLAMTNGSDYTTSYSGLSFNGIWGVTYASLLPDMQAMEEAAAKKGLEFHIANSYIMRSYILTTMVDLFGDVPFTEANQGTDYISPKVDPQSTLYDEALSLLDQALLILKNTTAPRPALDLYYGGGTVATQKDKWIALANTLKLRIYNNTRLVDASAGTKIKQILDNENVIDTPAEDFVFRYGDNRSNPNNRHPDYNDSYETSDGTYMSNYYMWTMLKEGNKFSIDDPRVRFYFFRQDTDLSDEDATVWDCYLTAEPVDGPSDTPAHYSNVDPDMCFCVARFDGYFGRDHGNNEGIPPDGPIRTVFGTYPSGGNFDDGKGGDSQKAGTTGGLGKGINPIMTSSFVFFMRAEAALTASTGENARDLLEDGVGASMDKVFSFKDLVDGTKVIGKDPQQNDITVKKAYLDPLSGLKATYLAELLAAYDAAGTNAAKLNIIMKEYHKALWGNGLEAYNNLRRTGYPSDVQPMIEVNPGTFIWSAYYPTNFVDRNQFATQKSMTDKIFWDNTPSTSVK